MLEADGLHTAACSGGRYARQEMLPEIGHAGQAKLRRAKVMIVGAGGLGSPVALYLAGAGVGTLTLVVGFSDRLLGIKHDMLAAAHS